MSSAADTSRTTNVEAPVPAHLLHANAGRILAEMLKESFADMEHEGDTVGPYRLCGLLGGGRLRQCVACGADRGH